MAVWASAAPKPVVAGRSSAWRRFIVVGFSEFDLDIASPFRAVGSLPCSANGCPDTPAPNRERKRLLILTLNATKVKVHSATESLTRQSDNVPFEQSRNVLLTAPSFGDARRTATDDARRSRPAGDVEESQGEADH